MGKKILLADDSITIQKVIELTFSDEDFEVVTVGNGRLAIERLPEARPDLVLCDIIMPEKDGYEVCDFIKKHPSLSHIPVLLLTGAFEPFDQERAARVGCDGFLAKPFEPHILIAKVKELLARAGSKPAGAATPATAPVSSTFAAPPASQPWASAMPSPAPPSFKPPPPPPGPEPESVAHDDFASGEDAFGAPEPGTAAYRPGADIGTVRSPVYDPYAAPPPSLDELYDDDPYGASNALMPLSDDEAESVSPPPAKAEDAPGPPWQDESPVSKGRDEPAPWAQPTVEVPLEMRAQASVEAQMAADGFEEVFEDEVQAPPARETAAAPTTAPSPAAAPTVKAGVGWVREADVSAPASAAKESPDSSFRDVSPAEEEEEPTSISRSVAGEVHVPVDMVEKIAQRVVAQISEKVIREIAWEVIPDLAEALIKREIDRLKAELQQP